jgi:hypothetical protein
MTHNFLNIDLNNITKKLNFTFLIDMGKSLLISKENEKTENSLQNLRNSTQDNTLFKINSEVFNIHSNKQELISSLDCFYSPSNEALCIIIEDQVKLKELSKQIISNLMEFSTKVSAKSLILLIDKKNKEYVKIMQSMMMIGFNNDSNNKSANISGKEYKVLKLDTNTGEIEEIAF